MLKVNAGERIFFHSDAVGPSTGSRFDNTEQLLSPDLPSTYIQGGWNLEEVWALPGAVAWDVFALMTSPFIAGVQTGHTILCANPTKVSGFPGGTMDVHIKAGIPIQKDFKYGATQSLYAKFWGDESDNPSQIGVGLRAARNRSLRVAPGGARTTIGKLTAGGSATQYFNILNDDAGSSIKTGRGFIIETCGCTCPVGTRASLGYADQEDGTGFTPFMTETKGFTNMASYGIPIPKDKYLLLKVEGTARTNLTLVSISSAADANINATSHGLSVGDYVYISGVDNSGTPSVANGYWRVKSVPDANNFTIEADTSSETLDISSATIIPNPNLGHYLVSYIEDVRDPRNRLLWAFGVPTEATPWTAVAADSNGPEYMISHMYFDSHDGAPGSRLRIRSDGGGDAFLIGFWAMDWWDSAATDPGSIYARDQIPCLFHKANRTADIKVYVDDYRGGSASVASQPNCLMIYERVD